MISGLVAVGGRWFPELQGSPIFGVLAMVAMVGTTAVVCLVLERVTIRSELARWLEELFGSTRNDDSVGEHSQDEPEEAS